MNEVCVRACVGMPDTYVFNGIIIIIIIMVYIYVSPTHLYVGALQNAFLLSQNNPDYTFILIHLYVKCV